MTASNTALAMTEPASPSYSPARYSPCSSPSSSSGMRVSDARRQFERTIQKNGETSSSASFLSDVASSHKRRTGLSKNVSKNGGTLLSGGSNHSTHSIRKSGTSLNSLSNHSSHNYTSNNGFRKMATVQDIEDKFNQIMEEESAELVAENTTTKTPKSKSNQKKALARTPLPHQTEHCHHKKTPSRTAPDRSFSTPSTKKCSGSTKSRSSKLHSSIPAPPIVLGADSDYHYYSPSQKRYASEPIIDSNNKHINAAAKSCGPTLKSKISLRDSMHYQGIIKSAKKAGSRIFCPSTEPNNREHDVLMAMFDQLEDALGIVTEETNKNHKIKSSLRNKKDSTHGSGGIPNKRSSSHDTFPRNDSVNSFYDDDVDSIRSFCDDEYDDEADYCEEEHEKMHSIIKQKRQQNASPRKKKSSASTLDTAELEVTSMHTSSHCVGDPVFIQECSSQQGSKTPKSQNMRLKFERSCSQPKLASLFSSISTPKLKRKPKPSSSNVDDIDEPKQAQLASPTSLDDSHCDGVEEDNNMATTTKMEAPKAPGTNPEKQKKPKTPRQEASASLVSLWLQPLTPHKKGNSGEDNNDMKSTKSFSSRRSKQSLLSTNSKLKSRIVRSSKRAAAVAEGSTANGADETLE